MVELSPCRVLGGEEANRQLLHADAAAPGAKSVSGAARRNREANCVLLPSQLLAQFQKVQLVMYNLLVRDVETSWPREHVFSLKD